MNLLVKQTSMYDESSFNDLRSRIEYETYFFTNTYGITDNPNLRVPRERVIYPASGEKPSFRDYVSFNASIGGDRGDNFKSVAAPLIFITTFKLLDMFVEWVLEQNEGIKKQKSWRFVQKKEALDQGIKFPHFIESKPWLKERLIGLYKELEPLRSTIIHNRDFKTNDGALRVSSTKSNINSLENIITEKNLRNLIALIISLLHYSEGSWSINSFGEKRLRCILDQLQHLHKLPLLGQFPPDLLIVRVYSKQNNSITVDLKRIHEDLTAHYPNLDIMFSLKVVTVNSDRNDANAYLISWDDLQNVGEKLVIRMDEISRYQCDLPEDIDVSKLLEDLNQAEFKSPVAS